MIRSWKDGEFVYIKMEGEFIADELVSETQQWIENHKDEYVGYIVDIRDLTKQSALEQKKAEAKAKEIGTKKPRALLGKDPAMGALVNIYKRFTGAQDMRYFTNEDEAKKWVLTFKE